jgi:hypothetical protein
MEWPLSGDSAGEKPRIIPKDAENPSHQVHAVHNIDGLDLNEYIIY